MVEAGIIAFAENRKRFSNTQLMAAAQTKCRKTRRMASIDWSIIENFAEHGPIVLIDSSTRTKATSFVFS